MSEELFLWEEAELTSANRDLLVFKINPYIVNGRLSLRPLTVVNEYL